MKPHGAGAYICRDATGFVLYVGASGNVTARIGQHASAPWWSDVADIEVQETASRDEALALETSLIRDLDPFYNKVRKIGPRKDRARKSPPHVPLRVLRNASRMTLDEVCAAASEVLPTPLTRGALSAIENGIRGASPATLAALEVAYGLSPGDIVVNYEPRNREQVLA